MNRTRGRREVKELTGNQWVPTLVLDDEQRHRRLAGDREMGGGQPRVAGARGLDLPGGGAPQLLLEFCVRPLGGARERECEGRPEGDHQEHGYGDEDHELSTSSPL